MAPASAIAKKNVQVIVRTRPMGEKECKDNCKNIVTNDIVSKQVNLTGRRGGQNERTFGPFDKVFGPETTQIELYNEVVAPLMQEILNGYNCTVFAYGQTGSGKTYTMEGRHSDNGEYTWETDPTSGVIPRALHQMFTELGKDNTDFTVRVSYVELYNEKIFDLLSNTSSQLSLRGDENKGFYVDGAEKVIVRTRDEVYELLKRGAEKRSTAETRMNISSSRSHSVFTVSVTIREPCPVNGEELLRQGKLNLVDLAGSENIGRSGATDKRAREAGNINTSLLALGRVINALTGNTPHIPYRESKLTQILQDSLGGKTITTIMAMISPASSNFEESVSTLEYAMRAKNVKNEPKKNQIITQRGRVKDLEKELEEKSLKFAKEHEELTSTITMLEEQNRTLRQKAEESNQKHMETIGQLQQITTEKGRLEVEAKKLQQNLEEQTKKCSEQEAKIGEFQQTLVQQDVELKKKSEQLDKQVVDLQIEKEECARLSGEIDRMAGENKVKNQQLEEFNEQCSKLKQQLLDKQQHFEREIEQAKEKLAESNKQHSEMIGQIASEKERIEVERQNMRNKLEEQVKKCSQQESKIMQQDNELQALQKKLVQQAAELQAKGNLVAESDKQHSELMDQMKQITSEKEQLKAKAEELQHNLEEQAKKCSQQETKLDEQNNELQVLQREMMERKAKLEKIEHEKKTAIQEKETLQTQNAELIAKMAEKEKKLARAVEVSRKKREQSRAVIKAYQDETDAALQKSATKRKALLADMNNKVQLLQPLNGKENERRDDQLLQQIKAEMEKLKQENTALTRQNQMLQNQKETMSAKLQAKTAKWDRMKQQLNVTAKERHQPRQ